MTPPCLFRWVIIPSGCVQMQRWLLSVASVLYPPVRGRPLVIASSRGQPPVNATLHSVVVVRLRWHEQTKAYASRRLKEGRSKAEIMRCLNRFSARDVFHTSISSYKLQLQV